MVPGLAFQGTISQTQMLGVAIPTSQMRKGTPRRASQSLRALSVSPTMSHRLTDSQQSYSVLLTFLIVFSVPSVCASHPKPSWFSLGPSLTPAMDPGMPTETSVSSDYPCHQLAKCDPGPKEWFPRPPEYKGGSAAAAAKTEDSWGAS